MALGTGVRILTAVAEEEGEQNYGKEDPKKYGRAVLPGGHRPFNPA